jgi:CRP-like cAMP-binding protein
VRRHDAVKSISDLAREYEIPRAAVAAVLDEHDVPTVFVGRARCVQERHLRRVRPILLKLRARMRERRAEMVTSNLAG